MATSSKRLSIENAEAGNIVQHSSDEYLSSTQYLDLIDGMKRGLDGATYYSDKIFDDLYPSVPCQDSFRKEFIEIYPEFVLPASMKASQFSASITALLNHIKQGMKHRQLLEHSIYKDVAFEVYNKEMMDSPKKDEKMKPHVIARIPSSSQIASWKEVEFFAQVDSDFPKLVARTASYAKAVFKSQRNRLFVLGIFLDHHTYEISFGVFHASGLIFPRKRYKLNDLQGYQEFIQAMVRVYSSSHRWRAGFDETCNNDECYISGFGTYSYEENLSYHTKIGGRRTRVDKVRLMGVSEPEVRSRNLRAIKRILSETSNVHSDDTQPASKKIKSEEVCVDNSDSTSIPAYLPLAPFSHLSENAPETLILKDSWPFGTRWDTESRMFQDVKGFFGIPEVYPGYKVIHSGAEETEADFFSRNDFETCNVSGGNYEPRVHVRLPMVTEGVPLTEAGSPRILVLGILHAMVGHWHLLKAGWLHRDVSIGNILLRKTVIRGLKIEGLNLENSMEYFSECTSFVADGDLAVKWQEEKELMVTPSGTLPFMSVKLVDAAAFSYVGRLPHHIHTAVDDLESFVWVLVWTVLDFVPKDTWTPLEARVHHRLNSDTVDLVLAKDAFFSYLKEAMELEFELGDRFMSSGFKVFAPLLLDWLTEAKRTAVVIKKNNSGPPDQLDFYENIYHNYISLALKSIDNLPDSWDYLRLQA